MEKKDQRLTVYVPPGAGIFVPPSVRSELIGSPPVYEGERVQTERARAGRAERPRADSPERPLARRPERPRSERSGDERPRAERSGPYRPRPLPAWMEILPEEEDDGGGPDEPVAVPPEILALAEEAMTHWPMKVSGMTVAATKPEKGWGAIWRIETDRGPRSLKLLHRPFERNLFSIHAQEYLTRRKFRVAPLVRSRQGEFYATVGGRMFIVTEWIEGLHPATKVTPDGAAALCYGLGEFHRASQGYQPPPQAQNASRLHRWPGVYQKMRTKIDWFEHLARAYSEMPASPVLLEVLPRFRAQADEAIARLERSAYRKLIARGEQAWGLVHQDV
ncbi:MAG: hypothetical protein ACOY93_21300 [Bacillota bacterium]